MRLKVLVPGAAAGAFCLALFAAQGLPSTWTLPVKVKAWGEMMSGPLLAIILGASYSPDAVSVVLALAWLSSPLILAHPIRPGAWTGCLTLFALLWWFLAAWITMIWLTWGA